MEMKKKVGIAIVVVLILAPVLLLLETMRLRGGGIPRTLTAFIAIGAYYALKSMFKKDNNVSKELQLDKTNELESQGDDERTHLS